MKQTILILLAVTFASCKQYDYFEFRALPADCITASSAVVDAINQLEIERQYGDGLGNLGFCYATHPEPTISDNVAEMGSHLLRTYKTTLSGLMPNTTYYYCIFDISYDREKYYNVLSFTTLPGQTLSDPRDGKIYPTVEIGNLVWMAEDLDYDTQTGYFDTDEHDIKMYDYETAQNVCMTGWRMATDEDWKDLERAIGIPEEQLNETGKRGSLEALALKSPKGWMYGDAHSNCMGLGLVPSGAFGLDGNNKLVLGQIDDKVQYFSPLANGPSADGYMRKFYDYAWHRSSDGGLNDGGRIWRSLRYPLYNAFSPVRCVKDIE